MSTVAPRHKYHWLPNALTVARILAIPALVWAILFGAQSNSMAMEARPVHIFAISLFIFCAVTDFLDGYFARKWKITSDFGRMLDPIADKLLVAACLIAICIAIFGSSIILIPALIIIGRDIFVSGIREHAANASLILIPTKLAKWKTACEMLAIAIFLIAMTIPTSGAVNGGWVMFPPLSLPAHVPNGILVSLFIALLWLAAILSAYTGFHYFKSAMRKVAPDLVDS